MRLPRLPELLIKTSKILSTITAEMLFSRPHIKVHTKSEIASFRAIDYSCPSVGYKFSRTHCMFYAFFLILFSSRFHTSLVLFLIHVFPRLLYIPRFPALSLSYMFSHTFYVLQLLPYTIVMISRSLRRQHDTA